MKYTGKPYKSSGSSAIFYAVKYFLNHLEALPSGPSLELCTRPARGLTASSRPPAGKAYELLSLHMVPRAPYSSSGSQKYFQIIYWGMKIWGKILTGYEIFGQNYWLPSTPLPGIVNDHSLSKKSFCTFEDIDLRESHAKLHKKPSKTLRVNSI